MRVGQANARGQMGGRPGGGGEHADGAAHPRTVHPIDGRSSPPRLPTSSPTVWFASNRGPTARCTRSGGGSRGCCPHNKTPIHPTCSRHSGRASIRWKLRTVRRCIGIVSIMPPWSACAMSFATRKEIGACPTRLATRGGEAPHLKGVIELARPLVRLAAGGLHAASS